MRNLWGARICTLIRTEDPSKHQCFIKLRTFFFNVHSFSLCCAFGDQWLGWAEYVSLQVYVINTTYNLYASPKKILITFSPEHTFEQEEQHQFWGVSSLWDDPEWLKPGDFLTHLHNCFMWQNELRHLSLELHRKAGVKCWAEGYHWMWYHKISAIFVDPNSVLTNLEVDVFPQHFCASVLERAWILFRKCLII